MSITLELTEEQEELMAQTATRARMDMPTFITATTLRAIRRELDDWERWEAAGSQAASEACDTLLQQEIGYVYGRDGKVYRKTQDGEEELSA